MRKLKLAAVTFLAAVAMVAALAMPAGAHPGVGTCTGSATVNPGLALPLLEDKYADWSFTTGCTGTVSGSLVASGKLIGGCGLSTGVGSGSFADHYIVVTWPTSAGTILPVVGRYVGSTHDSTGYIVAGVRAVAADQADPLTTLQQCIDGVASNFDVIVGAAFIGT